MLTANDVCMYVCRLTLHTTNASYEIKYVWQIYDNSYMSPLYSREAITDMSDMTRTKQRHFNILYLR